jgi:hypothetical protein
VGFGDQADVINRRFRYLINSRIAVSHHGSAPWIMHGTLGLPREPLPGKGEPYGEFVRSLRPTS